MSGPRIYNLFPLLAGPIADASGADWISHLPRIAAMNFDWVYVNPYHQSGFSGSLYAIKDYYALDARLRGSSGSDDEELLRRFGAAMQEHRLNWMIDLVINHTSKDSVLADSHPQWYRRNADGSLYSPRAVDPDDPEKVTVWGDLAALDYSDANQRSGMVHYWTHYIRHTVELGVRGFRCDAAYQVPAEVWAELILLAREFDPNLLFAAETLGCTVEETEALVACGFDYLFNSAKWWDFEASWLLDQYEQFRHSAPSIAFPESHDTPRLIEELSGLSDAQVEQTYRQRYLFAALFSSGVMMPMGYEYGFARHLHVVETTPDDWEPARFDLSDFIAAVNTMKETCPPLNLEGPQQLIELPQAEVCALLRCGDVGTGDAVISVLNLSSERSVTVSADDLLAAVPDAVTDWAEITPQVTARSLQAGTRLRLKPLAVRVFRSHDNVLRETPATGIDDYRFPLLLGELDIHLLAEGNHRRAYEKLGAHPTTVEGLAGVVFRVWAPNASRVMVVGDFNDWDREADPMHCYPQIGVWEVFIPGVEPGACYKYEITSAQGRRMVLKADPYGFAAEKPPQTASRVAVIDAWEWHDENWMQHQAEHNALSAPISIYEAHLASWKRSSEDPQKPLSYRELAEELVPYVKDIGFTHLELLPISEHPFDGSWGYQPLGLFAPTSRFGPPEDFKYFVERCHREEIGLLLDWVPGHFPADGHGLGYFDGTHLYEHADPRQGYHPDWNTLIYNFGRREVANFLLSNALFWLDRYHIDGLRVDAVASMLYLDYSRKQGEWIPNRYGGRENLEAIELLRTMNTLLYEQYPGVVTVAEESTAWPAVSRPVYVGGLGFGYKWNMGWMHDTLSYMKLDPIYRRYHHHQMTFGLQYAFNENFVLPLSHDEVVHGKGSLIARMPGDAWRKFANLRAYFGFMWTHPGKKLLFMGGEFAQGREWNHDAQLDWNLLDIGWHAGVQRLVRDLNALYRSVPALHQTDCDPNGFQWLEADHSDNSIYAYIRYGKKNTPPAVVICNFTPVPHQNYRLGVPAAGFYREVLNTDAAIYGGSNMGNAGGVHSTPKASHGRSDSIVITIPPLATVILVSGET